MRVVVLYRPRSEHESKVLSFSEEYKRLKGVDLELISLDTKEGSQMAQVYGITQYPALLALSQDGSLQRLWQGETLPLMNELEYYTQAVSAYSPKVHSPNNLSEADK